MIDWDRIESFAGYGRRDAPCVFIGMEESIAEEASLTDDLRWRSSFEQVMDIEKAHRGINGPPRFGAGNVEVQPTWRPICDLMVRREGNLNPTLAHRKDYQAYRLGRSNEAALLLELLPYPHRKLSEWTYKKWERFNTRAEYLESLLPLRKRLLRSLLNEAPREFIVCYGKKYWCHYKDLFGDANWENLSSFRRARTNATTIVLTYHFSRSHFWPDRTLAQLHRAVCIGVAH